MITDANRLPKGFEDLEGLSDWALPTEGERMRKRYGSDMETITNYYNVMVERIDGVLDYLDQFDLKTMPAPERRLLNMAQSLVEVANAVEVYGAPTSPFACELERFSSRTVDRGSPTQ
jgi:hypothetical protein